MISSSQGKQFSYCPSDRSGQYSVLFCNEIKSDYLDLIFEKYKNPVYIFDKNLPSSIKHSIHKFAGSKFSNIIEIDPSYKSLDQLVRIWEHMVTCVPDIAIGIGGGTTCDLVGLACATYQRGIARVLFPTTLLGQVDASIGGKTGIDFSNVKNSIGALQYPVLTINYLPFLRSLEKDEYYSGFAEIVKAAVLYDPTFFNRLLLHKKFDNYRSPELLDIFYTSARIKAVICEEPKNKKIRLLYGHAVGHAIEKISSKKIRHGDAVSIGMHIEGAMSCLLGYWTKEEWQKQKELLIKLSLPTNLPEDVDIDKLIQKMSLYKKLSDLENLYFVFPKTLGRVNNQDSSCLTPIKRKEIKKILLKAIDFCKL